MRLALSLSLIVALSGAAGCSGSTGGTGRGGGHHAPTTHAHSSAPAHPGYDPPLRFDSGSAKAMPDATINGGLSATEPITKRQPVALNGSTAYVAAIDRMWLISAETGQPMAQTIKARYELPMGGDHTVYPPLVTTIDGKQTVLASFPVEVPGHGTTPSHEATELTAADAMSGAVLWRTDLTVPDGSGADAGLVVGVHDGIAVVNLGGTGRSVTFGVDTSSHKQRWKHDGVDATQLIGDVVVGSTASYATRSGSVVALGADDGKQRWEAMHNSNEPYVLPATDNAVLGVAQGATSASLIDADGNVVTSIAGLPADIGWGDSVCSSGNTPTLICSGSTTVDEPFALGIDTAAGKLAWRLPASGRVAPSVTAVWHGAVYGLTANGPVVLDAKTGRDKEDSPGAAPVVVNSHYGIGVGKDPSAGAKTFRTSG